MPRAKVFLHEIWHRSLQNYIGMRVIRTNGPVQIKKIDGLGVHYLPEEPRAKELMTVSPRQFYIIVAFMPDFDEDDQFKEVHSYAWDDALKIIPKRDNGLFIPGMVQATPIIHAHLDNYGLAHITSRTRKSANNAADNTRAHELHNLLQSIRSNLTAQNPGLFSVEPSSGDFGL